MVGLFKTLGALIQTTKAISTYDERNLSSNKSCSNEHISVTIVRRLQLHTRARCFDLATIITFGAHISKPEKLAMAPLRF